MSNYNETIQQHNTSLQALIDTANTLPEAGSGGGNIINVTLNGIFEFIDTNGNIYNTNARPGTYQVLEGIVFPLHTISNLIITGNYITGTHFIRFLSDGGQVLLSGGGSSGGS